MSIFAPKQKKPKQTKSPAIDEASQKVSERDDLNRRRGSAANVLGGLGDTPVQTTAARLLGGGQ